MSKSDDEQPAGGSLGGNAATELALRVYDDAISDAMKELSPSAVLVAQSLNTVLRPLAGFVWAGKGLEKWIVERVASIAAQRGYDKVSSPAPRLAVPIVQQLALVGDEPELRDMYCALLASAMEGDGERRPHPGFVDVLNALSPEEARLLLHVARSERGLLTQWSDVDPIGRDLRSIQFQWARSCSEAGLAESADPWLHAENLLRLRVLAVERYQENVSNRRRGGAIVRLQQTIWLTFTEFGKAFLAACLPPEDLEGE